MLLQTRHTCLPENTSQCSFHCFERPTLKPPRKEVPFSTKKYTTQPPLLSAEAEDEESMHTEQDSLTGIVLAGGRSSRLGKDKAAIHLYGEQQPDLLARTCNLLDSLTEEVWISGRSGNMHNAEYLWIPDEVQGVGPVAGIMSALRTAQGPILVLSCDLPFMEKETLQRLIDARKKRPAETLMTTFLQQETGFIEALVSIYEFEALPYFEQAIEDGIYKISRTIPKKCQHTVPYERRDSLPFFNVNYPADLEMARRVISSL